MKEDRLIIITALLNMVVAISKLCLGLVFSFSTLIFDSIQSCVDFLTDIISLIVNKIGKRRANKTYPFGFGQVYYLSNILTGILLFLIGVFIVYQIFTSNTKFVPNLTILFALLIVLLIKYIVIIMLRDNAKSELLVESYRESKTDFISTCVVLLVLVISFYEKYIPEFINIDKIGSILMAIYVFYTAIKMIISNIFGILINDINNEEIKDSILNNLKQFKDLNIKNVRVIKISYYYSVYIELDVNDNMSIKKFLNIERKVKKCLKESNKLIKYVDVEPL